MTEQSIEKQAAKLMIAQARKNKVFSDKFVNDGIALELAKRVIQAEQERDQLRAEVERLKSSLSKEEAWADCGGDQCIAQTRQDALKEAIQAVANMPMYQANDGPLQGTIYGAVMAIQALAGKEPQANSNPIQPKE